MLNGLIIGGGITGLSLAHWLGLDQSPKGWELWESSDRLGGTLRTDRAEGYSVDWGPNGFLDREPLTLRLVDDIGLRDQLEPANENAENRYIVKNGKLHPVPFSPAKILTTGLLNPLEKLRIFTEPFIPARRDDSDESIYDFAARRIGHGAARMFVDPMVSGVFGGVAKELSLPSCFPIMRELEVEYGGLVKGMIAKKREKKRREEAEKATRKEGSPAGPGGRLTSFKGGLDALIVRLGERLQPTLRTSHSVSHVTRDSEGWTVFGKAGEIVQTRRLVVTCPTFVATKIFKDYDHDLSVAFGAVSYAPIIVVATGHRREDIAHSLDGFGFLIPRHQRIRTLGSIWTSSIFANRAPEGHVQLRTMLGGAGDKSALELNDEELWQTIYRELGPLIGIKADPVFTRIFRWERGIPQYVLGHRDRRARLEEHAARHPGLYFAGNAYHGVGLNDCVKMAKSVADRVLQDMQRPGVPTAS